MWIVQLALRRPYTFIVLALLILIVGPLMILRTPTDIFPSINIPIVSVIWRCPRSGVAPTTRGQDAKSGWLPRTTAARPAGSSQSSCRPRAVRSRK